MTVRELRKIFDDCWFAVSCDNWGDDVAFYEDTDGEEFEKYLDNEVQVCFPLNAYANSPFSKYEVYICCEIEEED